MLSHLSQDQEACTARKNFKNGTNKSYNPETIDGKTYYYSRSGNEHLTTASTSNDSTGELPTSSLEDQSESSSNCATPKVSNELLTAAPFTLSNADTESESTEGGTPDREQDRTVGAALASSSQNNVMVVYRRDSVVMAAGHLEEHQREIHGKRVPTDHVCVLLTAAKSNVMASFIASDPDENSFLEKGKFFAFPKQFIYRASLLNGSLQLAPYSATP